MTKPCELEADCPVQRRRAQIKRLARDPKRKGELAELAFLLAAATEGLVVSKPYGETSRYDFLVQGRRRVLRIQVKAAFSKCRRGYYFHLGTGPQDRYTEKKIDFVAAYVGPLDLWYIVPVRLIQSTSGMEIQPGACLGKAGARFEPYCEAWHLLTGRKSKKCKDADQGTSCPDRSSCANACGSL